MANSISWTYHADDDGYEVMLNGEVIGSVTPEAGGGWTYWKLLTKPLRAWQMMAAAGSRDKAVELGLERDPDA
jgi:hypothetical protein